MKEAAYYQLLSQTIGKRIRYRRKFEMDITLEELSALSTVDDKHIGEIERGNVDPRIKTLIKICEALNLDPVQFFQKSLSETEQLYKNNSQ